LNMSFEVINGRLARRKRIMQKAKGLFAEKGYHSVTVGEVAETCGIAKGTLYLYFDSKANLFFEIFFETYKEIFKQVTRIVDSKKDFEVIVLEILNYSEEFIRGNEFFVRFGKFKKKLKGANIPFEYLQKINESVVKMVGSFEEEVVSLIKDCLPCGKLNFNDVYEIIVSLIMAIEESDSETIKDTALSVLLDGVKKEVKC
jgi:AcrR family transcriptional regulator